jgi:hypothetical protein
MPESAVPPGVAAPSTEEATPLSPTAHHDIAPSVASTDDTVAVEPQPSPSRKRKRDDEDTVVDSEVKRGAAADVVVPETRPAIRPRTETFKPVDEPTPGVWDRLMVPWRTFVQGFYEGLRGGQQWDFLLDFTNSTDTIPRVAWFAIQSNIPPSTLLYLIPLLLSVLFVAFADPHAPLSFFFFIFIVIVTLTIVFRIHDFPYQCHLHRFWFRGFAGQIAKRAGRLPRGGSPRLHDRGLIDAVPGASLAG